MKRLIFTLFSLFLYLSCFAAQPYKSVLDGEITRWSFFYQYYCTNVVAFESTEIVAYGDTLLNDVVYKRLYIDRGFFEAEKNNTNWKNYMPGLHYQWENFFIRESEDASKLYIYNSDWDEEYLISDMNLEKEDKFQFFDHFNNPFEATVDSVYFENGLKHIRFPIGDEVVLCSDTCRSVQLYYTFIESVGSNVWLIYPSGCNNLVFGLNCFQNQATFYKNDGIMNYLNFAEFPCGFYYSEVGINPISNEDYSIFIQKDKIEIVFASHMNAVISVYDINGFLHYEQNVHSRNISIPTTEFAKGVYILNILDEDTHKLYTNKIIL